MLKNRVMGTQSIRRATLMMNAIAAHNHEGLRLVDLAQYLRLDRTTIHRIVKALVAEKFIARDPVTRRYFLGQTLFELGLSAGRRYDLRQVYHPILTRIAEKTGDTVFLNVRSGNDAVCVDRKHGPYPVKVFTLDIGDRRPLGTSASGVAIMSALPETEVKSIIRELESSDKKLRADAVLRAVKRAQEDGYALHKGVLKDVRAIAVPLKNAAGVPFAAIGVTAISSRMKEERHREVAELLKEGARDLEQLLPGQDISARLV
jgi:DNA-binding IclR family transcriptional regulator